MENRISHRLVLSCEHALNWVPDRYNHLFITADEVLTSHRGWDPGALILAHTIKRKLQAPLFIYPLTRLLIEPNRSEHHPALFSEFTRNIPVDEKTWIKEHYYRPYRHSVEEYIRSLIKKGITPIHLSIHTFTPELNNVVRDVDIGLLYDPASPAEQLFCRVWKKSLVRQHSNLKVRMNQPYKGNSDGFTTWLRKRFNEKYAGIELEVNQKYFFEGGEHWRELCEIISGELLHMQKD